MNTTSETEDSITNLVRSGGNIISLLHYLSAYPMAYYLAPALSLLAKSEKRVQQISSFSDTTSQGRCEDNCKNFVGHHKFKF